MTKKKVGVIGAGITSISLSHKQQIKMIFIAPGEGIRLSREISLFIKQVKDKGVLHVS